MWGLKEQVLLTPHLHPGARALEAPPEMKGVQEMSRILILIALISIIGVGPGLAADWDVARDWGQSPFAYWYDWNMTGYTPFQEANTQFYAAQPDGATYLSFMMNDPLITRNSLPSAICNNNSTAILLTGRPTTWASTGAPVRALIEPNQVVLSYEWCANSHIRWTAPAAGLYRIKGEWAGVCPDTTDYSDADHAPMNKAYGVVAGTKSYVSIKSSVAGALESGLIDGFKGGGTYPSAWGIPATFGTRPTQSYDVVVNLQSGETLDFTVGATDGSNNSDWYSCHGSVGLTATITSLPNGVPSDKTWSVSRDWGQFPFRYQGNYPNSATWPPTLYDEVEVNHMFMLWPADTGSIYLSYNMNNSSSWGYGRYETLNALYNNNAFPIRVTGGRTSNANGIPTTAILEPGQVALTSEWWGSSHIKWVVPADGVYRFQGEWSGVCPDSTNYGDSLHEHPERGVVAGTNVPVGIRGSSVGPLMSTMIMGFKGGGTYPAGWNVPARFGSNPSQTFDFVKTLSAGEEIYFSVGPTDGTNYYDVAATHGTAGLSATITSYSGGLPAGMNWNSKTGYTAGAPWSYEAYDSEHPGWVPFNFPASYASDWWNTMPTTTAWSGSLFKRISGDMYRGPLLAYNPYSDPYLMWTTIMIPGSLVLNPGQVVIHSTPWAEAAATFTAPAAGRYHVTGKWTAQSVATIYGDPDTNTTASVRDGAGNHLADSVISGFYNPGQTYSDDWGLVDKNTHGSNPSASFDFSVTLAANDKLRFVGDYLAGYSGIGALGIDATVAVADPPLSSIPAVKTASEGADVSITGARVSAAFDGFFYVETDNRTIGIRVNKAGHTLAEGMRADVSGSVHVLPSGEKCINAVSAHETTPAAPIVHIMPFAMANKSMNKVNLGLLVKVWGTVTQVIDDYHWTISDGSGVTVTVVAPNAGGPPVIPPPSFGNIMAVTGVCATEQSGTLARQIFARTSEDVIAH